MTTSAPIFRTRLTDLLRIRHPVLLGGMHHLSDAGYVAAGVRAGAMAYLTARSFDTPTEFRNELLLCHELAQGCPFGVNLTLARRPEQNRDIHAWLNMALQQGVRHFETAGMPPTDLVDPIHDAGGTLVHKCPSVRHAMTAQRLGVDVVALVGHEEGGHPGANNLSSFLNAAIALGRVSVPLVIGGGLGTGSQLAAAIAMGADGVVMGSRFMVAREIWAHDELKRRIVEGGDDCSTTILGSLNDTWRVMKNRTADEIQAIEKSGATSHRDFGDLILSTRTRDRVYIHGDVDDGVVSLGPAGTFADRIEPVARIIERLMSEAETCAHRFAAKTVQADLPTNHGPVRADSACHENH